MPPLAIEGNGETEAVARAVVSARVTGFIQQLKFEPGEFVDQDELLYVIEQSEYRAKHDAASAALASAKAAIEVAKAQVAVSTVEQGIRARDFGRQEKLKAENATSQAEYDSAKAGVESADAKLKSAQAMVSTAEAEVLKAEASLTQAALDLSYTEVKAPIAGKVAKTDVKVGNLVSAGSELTAIVNTDQVYVNFSISDREALMIGEEVRRRRAAEGAEAASEASWRGLPVYVRREIDAAYLHAGALDYVDREGVDRVTGTLALRGVFNNSRQDLIPGLFVHVRMPIGDPQEMLMVPERCIGRERGRGPFVMTVGEGGKVEKVSVELGQASGGWVVVVRGLTKDLQVVVEGLQRARPGLEVAAEELVFAAAELPADLPLPPAGEPAPTVGPADLPSAAATTAP